MKRSKILIFTFLFVFTMLLVSTFKVEASSNTNEALSIEGVQVRTSGEQSIGIRFVAEVEGYTLTNVTAYGVSIAFGEAEATDITVGGTVNEKSVLSAQVSETDNNKYYINLIGIPTTMYGQKVTARSYVVDNGEIIYSTTAVTRSLGQATLDVKSAGGTGDNIDTVINELNSNYKKVYKLGDYVYVTNSIYEYEPTNLAKYFIEDYNKVMSTSLTTMTGFAKTVMGSYTDTGTKDAIESNGLYTFFNANEGEMLDKWGWLLNYISDTVGNDYVTKQVKFINGTTSIADSNAGWWGCRHLLGRLECFFTRTKVTGIGFDATNFAGNAPSKGLKETINELDNKFLANNSYDLYRVGETIKFEEPTINSGYAFDGYLSGETYYQVNDTYVIGSDLCVFEPKSHAIEYSINYYNDNEEVTTLTDTYTVEEEVELPTLSIDGYDFLGWYEESDFSGNVVTKISKGSTGNKVFYAKLEEAEFSNVNVTLDFNGGYLLYETVEDAIADFLVDYNKARGKSHTVDTFYTLGSWGEISDASLFLYNANYRAKWNWLVEYIATVASSANKVAWTTFNNYNSQAELNAANGNNIYRIAYELRGWVAQKKYSANANFVTADYSSDAIKASSLIAANGPTSYVYKEPFTMPVVKKDGFVFAGWKSSVDGSVITEYPGYESNPGNVTYTAQWKVNSSYVDVNVTYDPNGGYWDTEVLLDNITPTQQFTLTRYLNYNSAGNAASLHNAKPAIYWYYIALEKTEYKDVYEITQFANINSGITVDYDYVIMWYKDNPQDNMSALTSIYSNKANYLGDYVSLQNVPNASSTSANITVSVFEPSELNKNLSVVYNEPTSLLTPTKTGYNFKGWKSSVDGSVVTKFPGYTTNPGNITYTAQWEAGSLQYAAELAYKTDSFVNVGESIELIINYAESGTAISGLTWSSSDSTIATVDQNGKVTGVKSGFVYIRAALSNDNYVEFGVTVIDGNISDILALIVEGHQSNIFTSYSLGIGAGTPAYYYDVIGSVNDITFNEQLVIDKTYATNEIDNATADYYDPLTSLEFVTVHYTGNMSVGADAQANASYFSGDNDVSIHYTTGNDGVYQALPHEYGAWHAGDSRALNVVGEFKWTATGVLVAAGDPKFPVFTISDDFYYEINGKKTSIPMATPWNYNSRNTDHVLNSDGTISSKSGFAYPFSNRTPESFINDQGLPFKIVDGQYYMGTTWWAYHQVYEGRICGSGGNRNSIGIESCVDKGSDLWYTWQKTAQLVGWLLYDNNLEITRVAGHHFFDGKDCPQPMLENDLEIWYIFLDMAEKELQLLDLYSNYTISMEVLSGEVANTGRVKQVDYSQICTYKVTVTNKTTGVSESITLSSALEGTNSR